MPPEPLSVVPGSPVLPIATHDAYPSLGGAGRLLAALARAGLPAELAPAAARLCVELDRLALEGSGVGGSHGQVEGEEREPALAA